MVSQPAPVYSNIIRKCKRRDSKTLNQCEMCHTHDRENK